MTESEPTRGHYTFVHQFNVECDRRGIANCGGYSPSHGQQEAFEENKANALLVADAFNVYNETGLTPRQLAERNKEAIELLYEIQHSDNIAVHEGTNDSMCPNRRERIDSFLNKAKGAA